jgi:hypothetical protein
LSEKFDPVLPKHNTYYIGLLKNVLCGLPTREKVLTRAHFANSIQATMYRQIHFMAKLPKAEKSKFVKLPDTTPGRKLIIFDLDETLLHCQDTDIEKCMIQMPVTFSNGVTISVNPQNFQDYNHLIGRSQHQSSHHGAIELFKR